MCKKNKIVIFSIVIFSIQILFCNSTEKNINDITSNYLNTTDNITFDYKLLNSNSDKISDLETELEQIAKESNKQIVENNTSYSINKGFIELGYNENLKVIYQIKYDESKINIKNDLENKVDLINNIINKKLKILNVYSVEKMNESKLFIESNIKSEINKYLNEGNKILDFKLMPIHNK